MKKLVFALMAVAALCACQKGGAPVDFNYRGLAFTMPVAQFVDSMTARGFAVDSAASDSGKTVVLASPAEHYRVLAAFNGEKLMVIQETYNLSELRDGLEKELGAWPDCPVLKEDHKEANFDAGEGLISVLLENTYTPTLTVRYTKKNDK